MRAQIEEKGRGMKNCLSLLVVEHLSYLPLDAKVYGPRSFRLWYFHHYVWGLFELQKHKKAIPVSLTLDICIILSGLFLCGCLLQLLDYLVVCQKTVRLFLRKNNI